MGMNKSLEGYKVVWLVYDEDATFQKCLYNLMLVFLDSQIFI